MDRTPMDRSSRYQFVRYWVHFTSQGQKTASEKSGKKNLRTWHYGSFLLETLT